MQTVNDRIQALRAKMKEQQLDTIILPSNDPHQSEYVSDYWKIREHFSGFTGSAGTLVITQNEAALWTDSRYFLQVEEECKDSEVTLHKQTIPHAPEHIPWLANLLKNECAIGLDFRLFTIDQIQYIKNLFSIKNLDIKDINGLIESLWLNRPFSSTSKIVDHPVDYCGVESKTKIAGFRFKLEVPNKYDYYILSRLDNIAYLFNIRLDQFAFDPCPLAYAVVGKEQSFLFTEKGLLEESLISRFQEDQVEVLAYEEFLSFLASLNADNKIAYEKGSLNYASFQALKSEVVEPIELAQYKQAHKNEVELENAKKCMIKDGVAMTKFFIWLENHLESNTISEYELGKKLESFRKEQELYKGESFAAIVGYKGNGAIIHYTAPEKGSAEIKNEGILLLDRGAQYENGTTDITRTLWLGGAIPEEIKIHYTAVLQGYIALDTIVFPFGTKGVQLDAFARAPLWKLGLDYGHGTGHGIGSFGLVHEPLQGFATSTTTSRGSFGHFPNHISTIEPGYYKQGEYGIRIENCVASKMIEFGSGQPFVGFEAITLFPIDTQLIDQNALSNEDISWLNAYHDKVYRELSPYLTEQEKIWLKKKCEKI